MKKFNISQLKLEFILDILQSEEYIYFLDSSCSTSESQFSLIAYNPFLSICFDKNQTLFKKGGHIKRVDANPLLCVEKYFKKFQIKNSLVPFSGGAIGYISYEYSQLFKDFKHINFEKQNNKEKLPLLYFSFFDYFILIDKKEKSTWFIIQGLKKYKKCPYLEFKSKVDNYCNKKYKQCNSNTIKPLVNWKTYRKNFEKIKSWIKEGDIYQANYTMPFTVPSTFNNLSIYKKLRKVSPAPYSAFFKGPFGDILSSSPEKLFSIENKIVQTKPIKGTIRRRGRSEKDNKSKKTLLSSIKDQAELTMIVDLERNDLTKVCRPGTISVKKLKSIEDFQHVFHLVSTIEGELAEGLTAIDVLMAMFPGGSITGAPKIRAMEIINEVESQERQIYTGSMGYISFNGRSQFNIAIRTMYSQNENLMFHAGGGIVADSEVKSEWEEAYLKAEGMKNSVI
ncbi:aminodeoxychorismate synthase component I [Candidatus Marinamargulisbacteria bacterium SCGC AG-410-N11]|nr:aminodeoxychorismate synthase component I [Candidatus Marinamargulisbacteria bacterium SCGC AG-410-N11]